MSEILKLRDLHVRYLRIHEGIKDLEARALELAMEQKRLSLELESTRKEEDEIINKIEKEWGRKIMQEDLAQIIKTNE